MEAGTAHSVEMGDVYDLYAIQGSVRASSPIVAAVTPQNIERYTTVLNVPGADSGLSSTDYIVAVQVAHDSKKQRGPMDMWRRGLRDPPPVPGRPDSAMSSPTRSIKNFFTGRT